MKAQPETTITLLQRQLALLDSVLSRPLDRDPPPGVPFEVFARQVLGPNYGGNPS